MPRYDYRCEDCGKVTTKIRRMAFRNNPVACQCGEVAERIFTVTHINSWQENWKFPHLRPEGDGQMSFRDEATYKAYLSERGFSEVGCHVKLPPPRKVLRRA